MDSGCPRLSCGLGWCVRSVHGPVITPMACQQKIAVIDIFIYFWSLVHANQLVNHLASSGVIVTSEICVHFTTDTSASIDVQFCVAFCASACWWKIALWLAIPFQESVLSLLSDQRVHTIYCL